MEGTSKIFTSSIPAKLLTIVLLDREYCTVKTPSGVLCFKRPLSITLRNKLHPVVLFHSDNRKEKAVGSDSSPLVVMVILTTPSTGLETIPPNRMHMVT